MRKGTVLGYLGMFAILAAAAAVVIFLILSGDVKRSVVTNEGKIISFVNDVDLKMRSFDEGLKYISQRVAYDMGKNGGLIYETFWTEQYPTIDILKNDLLKTIKKNLPTSYKEGSVELTWEEPKIAIEGYNDFPCGVLNDGFVDSLCFLLRGSRAFKYYDTSIDTSSSEDHEINSKIDSSYFKLLYAGREIFENENYKKLLTKAVELESTLNSDPRFGGLEFRINVIQRENETDILEITIEDPCLDFDYSCLSPLKPGESGIRDWEGREIPYDRLRLEIKAEAEQEEPTKPFFDYSVEVCKRDVFGRCKKSGEISFIDCQFHMVCDHTNQQCALVQGAGESECVSWEDCIGGCRPDIIIDKTATPVPGTYPNCENKANIKLTVTGIGCEEIVTFPVDIMLVTDRSGSMEGTKLADAKNAAKNFVDLLNGEEDRCGLVSYNDGRRLDQQLTFDKDAVKSALSDLYAGGMTDIMDAIKEANEELKNNGRADVPHIEVLLTDGNHNTPHSDPAEPLSAAAESKQLGIKIYTIGLGSDADQTLLKEIAEMTGGKYYFAPTSSELKNIYKEISEEIFNIAANNVTVFDFIQRYGTYETGTLKVFDNQKGQVSDICSYQDSTRSINCDIKTVYIDQTYSISFDVKLNEPGDVLTNIYPQSSVNYTHHAGFQKAKVFPETYVHVNGDCADTVPPKTTIKCDGEDCFKDCWYLKTVEISLSCWDGYSGCKETWYCVDRENKCNPNKLYTAPFKIETHGGNYIRYYSVDFAGNIEVLA